MPFVEANGAKIPAIGLGTWELGGRTCARLVEQALKLGYRHIDTAQAYDNEREVGDGLRASSVRRDEVFVTTKVWTNQERPYSGPNQAGERQNLRSGLPALARAAESCRDTAHVADRAAVGKYRHLRLRAVRRGDAPNLADGKRQSPAHRFRFRAEMGLRLLRCPLC